MRSTRFATTVFLVLSCVTGSYGLSFTVAGSWSLVIGSSDLSGGPGGDLVPEFVSAADALVFEVTGAVDQFEAWYVDIQRIDISWDPALHIELQRTSNGSGIGTISGGTGFLEAEAASRRLFQGTGDRSSVLIQLKLSGVSVTVGADTYSTQIVFTLLDAP